MDDDVLLISGGCSLLARQCFFLSWNFAKFQPEKIWFRPIQRIFHETKKFTQIHHISILLLLFFKSSDCCDEFQSVAKNIERFYFFFFLLSFLVCNLIWLNCFLDDRHFGYITKIPFPPPVLTNSVNHSNADDGIHSCPHPTHWERRYFYLKFQELEQ